MKRYALTKDSEVFVQGITLWWLSEEVGEAGGIMYIVREHGELFAYYRPPDSAGVLPSETVAIVGLDGPTNHVGSSMMIRCGDLAV